jgi:hypothetical protein
MKQSPARIPGKITQALLIFSAVWSVAIGIWIAASPMYTSEVVTNSGPGPVVSSALGRSSTSFFSVNGAWGIMILGIFAIAYSSGIFFFRRCRTGWTLVTGLFAILLTFLAGFSIGPVYLPAALATLLALILMGAKNISPRAEE